MNNRTLRSLIAGLVLVFASLGHASEKSETERMLKVAELQDKFGNYQLIGGDSTCEHNVTLQRVELRLGGSPKTVVELVATEIAAESYIWRKGLSTLFVQINGKKVHDRSINSRNQAYHSEFRSTYEEGVLISILEYKNSFVLFRLDKESIVTTLDFNTPVSGFSYHQLETDEDKNTVATNCEYDRVY